MDAKVCRYLAMYGQLSVCIDFDVSDESDDLEHIITRCKKIIARHITNKLPGYMIQKYVDIHNSFAYETTNIYDVYGIECRPLYEKGSNMYILCFYMEDELYKYLINIRSLYHKLSYQMDVYWIITSNTHRISSRGGPRGLYVGDDNIKTITVEEIKYDGIVENWNNYDERTMRILER